MAEPKEGRAAEAQHQECGVVDGGPEESTVPSLPGPPEPAHSMPGDEGAEVFTAAPCHDQLVTVVGGMLTEQDPVSRGTTG